MGKFERFAKKTISMKVDGMDLEIAFKVRDRMELASVHEIKNPAEQYDKLIEFCTKLLVRSYPEENPESFDGFLSTNLENFIEELMVGANLAKREHFAKRHGDFRKEEKDGNKGGVQEEVATK